MVSADDPEQTEVRQNDSWNGILPEGISRKTDSVKYKGEWYKLSRGLGRFHPGGTDTIRRYLGRDVSTTMSKWNHSPAAYALLEELSKPDKLVDWNKPMILQVGKLGKSYYDWIDEPVNRPLRLFRNDFIERLTRTNYVTVLVYWIPIVSYMVWVNFSNLVEGQRFKLTLSSFLLGMALWPLIEYVVHRWLFHSKPPSNWPSLLTLHFLIHGIHHKAPFDNGRLLFPPVPCSILFFVLYGFYTLIFPGWMLLATMAGTIAGYLCYDMTHYYLHYGSPKEGTYFYNMKRSHNNHHFANQTAGFGISTEFWDRIFDTMIELKKLDFPLRWYGGDSEEEP